MTPNLMIDLETLSTSPRAVVTQLGWALFDPDATSEGVVRSGCYHLDVESQIKNGLDMDWSTIEWWLKQDRAAQDLMVNPPSRRMLASEALGLMEQQFPRGIEGVWSHGATFDVVIVENLYRKAGRKPPWAHHDIRDTRTLFWLTGKERLVCSKNALKHSAEHDAVAQAITVQRAVKIMRNQCTSSTVETSITPSPPVSDSSVGTAFSEIHGTDPSSSLPPPSPPSTDAP